MASIASFAFSAVLRSAHWQDLFKLCSFVLFCLFRFLLLFSFLFVFSLLPCGVVVVGRGGIGGGRELGLGRRMYVSVCWRACVAVYACLSWRRLSDRRACFAAALATAAVAAATEATEW